MPCRAERRSESLTLPTEPAVCGPGALWKCRSVDAGGKLSSRGKGTAWLDVEFPIVAHRPWKSQMRDFHIPTAPTMFSISIIGYALRACPYPELSTLLETGSFH